MRNIYFEIQADYELGSRQFRRTLGNLLGPRLVDGNQVDLLKNGDRIFPAMLEAISDAQTNINFETFIYWSGEIGRVFAEALAERARAGVSVHVLLDWYGSATMDPEHLSIMRDAGVHVEKYHPFRWYNVYRLNHRTHRKLLIVDGRMGFIGGVGIADQWQGNAENEDHWRDDHFRVEGPAVAQMQTAFMDNWMRTHEEVLHDERYFPELRGKGDMSVQVFKSSAREGSESIYLLFQFALALVRRNLRIASAYFVPDDFMIQKLIEVRKRGVRIQVIAPGAHIHYRVVRKASKLHWGKLLEAGIEIYEYQPTMYHCKALIIDDLWTSVGSTNFDNRSFRLNDEANLNVIDRGFARQMIESFDEDLTRSKRIELQQWRNRPVLEKGIEWGANLFRSQL